MPSKPKSRRCYLCGESITERAYVLRDRDRKVFGYYCSRECAHNDSWGPIFNPCTIRIEPKKAEASNAK